MMYNAIDFLGTFIVVCLLAAAIFLVYVIVKFIWYILAVALAIFIIRSFTG